VAYYNEIELWKDVKPEEWNDWRWQVENRIDSVEKLKKVINVTEEEEEIINKVLEKFRMGITPYYAAHMDKDDPRDPIRMQAVPTFAETHVSAADMVDPLHEDEDSPAPGLTHRYPDRVLFLITDQCSMYCRHCTRRRFAGQSDDEVGMENINKCIRNDRRRNGFSVYCPVYEYHFSSVMFKASCNIFHIFCSDRSGNLNIAFLSDLHYYYFPHGS
jgi:lysine 2,3-aminomutase